MRARRRRRSAQLGVEARLLEHGSAWWRETGDGTGTVAWQVRDVPLKGTGLHMHTLEYHMSTSTSGSPDADDPEELPLVMLHGFGFGASLFYAALPAIASAWRGRVFAVDMLGSGLSSRPPWPLRRSSKCDVDAAEQYFVDALEAWRESLGLACMVLLGHSVGGYHAVAYAERFPQRCRQLVLASPAGVPRPPERLQEWQASGPWQMRLVLALWRRGFSPFTIANALGKGRKMMTGYVTRRFANRPWIPKAELIEYLVSCVWCGGRNSAGGYVHETLLTPGGIPDGSQGEFVYARKPLFDRLLGLNRTLTRLSFIYGEYDWMYWRNALDVVAAATQQQPDRAPNLDLFRVAQGTHQHMIDNPRGFADAVLAAVAPESSERRAGLATGSGFGGRYGATARVWQREAPLPQDDDPITTWAPGHEPPGATEEAV